MSRIGTSEIKDDEVRRSACGRQSGHRVEGVEWPTLTRDRYRPDEILQRSSLPLTDVLSYWSEAPTAPTSIPDLLACREVIR